MPTYPQTGHLSHYMHSPGFFLHQPFCVIHNYYKLFFFFLGGGGQKNFFFIFWASIFEKKSLLTFIGGGNRYLAIIGSMAPQTPKTRKWSVSHILDSQHYNTEAANTSCCKSLNNSKNNCAKEKTKQCY